MAKERRSSTQERERIMANKQTYHIDDTGSWYSGTSLDTPLEVEIGREENQFYLSHDRGQKFPITKCQIDQLYEIAHSYEEGK